MVYGSDRGKIGEVEEIVPAEARTPGYLLVKRGAVFNRDTYIPLDAVTRQVGQRVFINVPRLVVGKMPWDEPPTAEGFRGKQGPPRREVKHLYGSRSPSGASA